MKLTEYEIEYADINKYAFVVEIVWSGNESVFYGLNDRELALSVPGQVSRNCMALAESVLGDDIDAHDEEDYLPAEARVYERPENTSELPGFGGWNMLMSEIG